MDLTIIIVFSPDWMLCATRVTMASVPAGLHTELRSHNLVII